uniref:Uncharacterized protein n=1 Tax=Rhizophora mucronata TaxID=61149 RepID=A0A2P2N743_RHIMU
MGFCYTYSVTIRHILEITKGNEVPNGSISFYALSQATKTINECVKETNFIKRIKISKWEKKNKKKQEKSERLT